MVALLPGSHTSFVFAHSGKRPVPVADMISASRGCLLMTPSAVLCLVYRADTCVVFVLGSSRLNGEVDLADGAKVRARRMIRNYLRGVT